MSDKEQGYRIRLCSQNHEFEVEGSKEFVEKWYEDYKEDQQDLSKSSEGSSSLSGTVSTMEKERSVAEVFQNNKDDFSTKQDNALFIGWCLENIKGVDQFTLSRIEDLARSNKVPIGKNMTRDKDSLVKKGLLKKVGEEDGQSTFYLTRSGEEHIEDLIE